LEFPEEEPLDPEEAPALGEEDLGAAALGEEDLVAQEDASNFALGEEDLVAQEDAGNFAFGEEFYDEIDPANLALDGDEAAFAAGNPASTFSQPATASSRLPSWGVALVVLGVFIAIACILVVFQLFIYFRSA